MECKISPENAKTLDKVFAQRTIHSVILSTFTNVTLQAKLENSSLYINVVLLQDFFSEVDIKDRTTVEFQKVKLYLYEMEHLEIKVRSHFVEFFWKFKLHSLTKTLCVVHTNLRNIELGYNESFELDGFLVHEIVRQLNCNELVFNFGDRIAFYDLSSPDFARFEIENSTSIRDTSFSILRKSIKVAVEFVFEKIEFLVDRGERRLCICMESNGIIISHLTSIYIEK